MDKRKGLILNTIIKEHIKTGTPVGSGVLVNKYKLDISPATARNEMASLEEEGYIIQPHTSAGRIPTEEASRLYLEDIKEKKLRDSEIDILESILENNDEADFKKAAKVISEISDSAVFWAFHKNSLYYTGISNLFKQPEFTQTDLIYDISSVIDRMDEIIEDIFDDLEKGPGVLLGQENPFGNFCSSILAKYKNGDNHGLVGIIGPMRMDYEKNIALIKYIFNKINN